MKCQATDHVCRSSEIEDTAVEYNFEGGIPKDHSMSICCFCSDSIEDETHVLLNCPFYDAFRENVFNVAKSYTVDFMSFNNEEKIMFLFSNENMIRICAKTCLQILKRRRNSLYCK